MRVATLNFEVRFKMLLFSCHPNPICDNVRSQLGFLPPNPKKWDLNLTLCHENDKPLLLSKVEHLLSSRTFFHHGRLPIYG